MTAVTATLSGDLAFYLKRLRLPRLGEHLTSITQRAAEEGWSYEEFLTTLLEQEVFARDQLALERRIRAARFPSRNKTLENFDFTFQTSVKKQVLLHLASLRFVELKHNVIFLGPPGTGIWSLPWGSKRVRPATRFCSCPRWKWSPGCWKLRNKGRSARLSTTCSSQTC